MPKKSTIKHRNAYLDSREACGMTRAQASEQTGISESRIEKIESEKILPYPEDVLAMADAYKNPALPTHYCAADCPIGRKYVPEVENKSLSGNRAFHVGPVEFHGKEKERMIEITADGKIDEAELQDFVRIQKELDEISANADSLRLWIEQSILSGTLDAEKMKKERN